ncbi:hypothetical protein [Rhodococcus chondri]|uniref:Lipoprotein n=1 Tax=Rhodococcus chondri TaxID=3065941 RepID=A0ABU7JR55_9NOCA|nr:hypothetical protein [Rhodococcus sp. CC-R104]MEE2031979.1 hypothetical protein [Rhodococcus sp. CC-R104]
MGVGAGRFAATAVLMLLSACAQPHRSKDAEDLESAVAAMSGVEDVDVLYTNDFSLGSDLDVDIAVEEARIAEIVAVAAVLERRGTLDPESLGDETRALRAVLREIPGTEVAWSYREGEGHSLGFGRAPAGAALMAVRSHIDAHDLTVTVGEFDAAPRWTVTMPLGISAEKEIHETVEQLPLPARALVVEDGHVSMATVVVENEGEAETDLAAVIAAFTPTEEHPLMLEWQGTQNGRDDERRFAGRVHIAGCAYPAILGESEPERFYAAEAMELRDRLRARYDTCD